MSKKNKQGNSELTYTPSFDVLIDRYGRRESAVYGRIWRRCQAEAGICYESIENMAQGIDWSYKRVKHSLKLLVQDGWLKDLTPDIRNDPHVYVLTNQIKEAQTEYNSHKESLDPANNRSVKVTEHLGHSDLAGRSARTSGSVIMTVEDTFKETNKETKKRLKKESFFQESDSNKPTAVADRTDAVSQGDSDRRAGLIKDAGIEDDELSPDVQKHLENLEWDMDAFMRRQIQSGKLTTR